MKAPNRSRKTSANSLNSSEWSPSSILVRPHRKTTGASGDDLDRGGQVVIFGEFSTVGHDVRVGLKPGDDPPSSVVHPEPRWFESAHGRGQFRPNFDLTGTEGGEVSDGVAKGEIARLRE